MVNMDVMETKEAVDWLVFPDLVDPLESPDYPDLRDTEVSLDSPANPVKLVLMDLRELWVIWDPSVAPAQLDPVVPTEKEEDPELLDQPVFVV